jgi:glycosyltransferase involved in cell wall biosynthesis
MKKRIVISGPILSRSGYGEMARFALRSLLSKQDFFDIFLLPTNWGNTGNLFEDTGEKKYIDSLILKTQALLQQTNNQPNFDISIQVTIPNEWKKMASYNIGYTAGIETNLISSAWFQPTQQMDKVIVISEHAKSGFMNVVFGDQFGNQYKVTTPVEVCHFPTREFKDVQINLDFKHEFNFLTVCQWSPRKNLEQTILAFLEEFKNEEVGLVLKINTSNDSLIDREMTEARLESLLQKHKERKCSVYLLHGHMSEEEMQSLYRNQKIKAFVSSTHGEGFGFPLFEASYNEKPIIVTDWSGHLDFLSIKDEDSAEKKMFAKVDYELKPIAEEHVWNGVLDAGTQWAYPIHSILRSKMREVFKDYPRFKSWAKKLAKYNKEKFTENKVYQTFTSYIIDQEELKRMEDLKGDMIDLNSLQDEVIVVNE